MSVLGRTMMDEQKAISLLRRIQDPEPYEPQITDDAYYALEMGINALEERKTGKWIRHPIYPGSDHYYYACSECDYRSWSKDNFCSVCGAKMEVKDDE